LVAATQLETVVSTGFNIPQFDTFIAMDWSGATGRYNGIAVAICETGRRAPRLVEPRGGRSWTREAIADWLEDQLDRGERNLIGLDFAFGFPFETKLGYLGGRAPEVDRIFALWSLIESQSCDDPDFGCAQFITNPEYDDLFWKSGTRPANWIERKRRTEHACAEKTGTRPDTLYKLLHSKQVGKASITGMRVLHQVRSRKGDRVAIWPFEAVRSSAIVEIYPTMFRKIASGSIAKLKSVAELNEALTNIGSRAFARSGRQNLSDHETDALISAAGLRWMARNPGVWSHRELRSQVVRREGWIFGVV
jgi:hypothetical protein